MNILHIILYLLAVKQYPAQFSSIMVTGKYPMTLPRSSYAMAVGYDSNNDTILLVGGLESGAQQFVTFKNNEFVDHGMDYLPQGFDGYILYGFGQFYSQMGSTLWMLNAMTWEKITPFDANTWNVNDASIAIADYSESGDLGCLASLNNGYNKYLFVVGAWPGNSNDNYLTLIYNISSLTWLTQTDIPTLNDNRNGVSCIVHNDRLYAIGGSDIGPIAKLDNTVESLYIGQDLTNIRSESWQYTINNLSSSMGTTRAVVYDDNIFVIPTNMIDINIINTLTNSISVGGRLTNSFSNPTAAIVVNHVLYMFGGGTEHYQYIDLQSITPTSPTVPTTERPTSDTSTPSPSNADIIDVCEDDDKNNRCHGNANECDKNKKQIRQVDVDEWCVWCLCEDYWRCVYYALPAIAQFVDDNDMWESAKGNFTQDVKNWFMETCFGHLGASDCSFAQVELTDPVTGCKCETFTCNGHDGKTETVDTGNTGDVWKYSVFGTMVVAFGMVLWI